MALAKSSVLTYWQKIPYHTYQCASTSLMKWTRNLIYKASVSLTQLRNILHISVIFSLKHGNMRKNAFETKSKVRSKPYLNKKVNWQLILQYLMDFTLIRRRMNSSRKKITMTAAATVQWHRTSSVWRMICRLTCKYTLFSACRGTQSRAETKKKRTKFQVECARRDCII